MGSSINDVTVLGEGSRILCSCQYESSNNKTTSWWGLMRTFLLNVNSLLDNPRQTTFRWNFLFFFFFFNLVNAINKQMIFLTNLRRIVRQSRLQKVSTKNGAGPRTRVSFTNQRFLKLFWQRPKKIIFLNLATLQIFPDIIFFEVILSILSFKIVKWRPLFETWRPLKGSWPIVWDPLHLPFGAKQKCAPLYWNQRCHSLYPQNCAQLY